ncbi:MAG: CRTAC1 family protein [Thermoguttaceae bacterium]
MVSRSDMRRQAVAGWCAASLLSWLAVASAGEECAIRFRDVTAETGIDFVHTHGGSGRKYIVETVTAGLATLDYDNDGKIDIYFLNGRPLAGTEAKVQPKNRLYRNLGGMKFKDVTDEAGVGGGAGYGLGVCVADYDNDGYQDLYLSNYGENILYHNNGDGTFTDVARKAGVTRGHRVGAGACFLDYDNDGHLDLFAANYVKFSEENRVVKTISGFPVYSDPTSDLPETHSLFHNNGDGTFTDVSEKSGIAARPSYGMGVTVADYDNDGYPDIFVANDASPNVLFHNDRQGKFKDVALLAGVACDIDGRANANMGVDSADYNNTGLLSFYVTSYQNQLALLFKNRGRGLFDDVTLPSGAGSGTRPYVTWGCGFVDFDNDGHRDLFIVCGHLQDNVEMYDDTTAYRCRNIVLRNMGNGKFVNVTDQCGDVAKIKMSGRGVAFEDLDNDGRIDVVILNSNDKPTILRNESVTGNHWIQVRLRGVKTNRDGVGARVYVVAGDLKQMDEVHSGRGYQSHWGTRLHFGLAKNQRVERIEVHWPRSGVVDILEDVPADQSLTIVEGSSPSKRKPLFVYPQVPTMSVGK